MRGKNELESLVQMLTSAVKLAVLVGGVAVVAYSFWIGRFPQGVSFGDSLLLLAVAGVIGVLGLLFVASLIGLGIVLSPIVHAAFWVAGKLSRRFAAYCATPYHTLEPISASACVLALFSAMFIEILSRQNSWVLLQLPVLAIALYFIYSVFISAGRKIQYIDAIYAGPYQSPSIAEAAKRKSLKLMQDTRVATAALVLVLPFVPLFNGGQTGELLAAAMRGAHVRIEKPVVYLALPQSEMLPATLAVPSAYAPAGYKAFRDVRILFAGFGSTTAISFLDGTVRREIDVPNDKIIVERQVR